MILLTGATGTIGKELTGLFARENTRARVLVRDIAAGEQLEAQGFEVLIGDMDSRASVEKALNGVETAFLLAANTKNQWLQEKQFVDVALQSNVSRIVKMSATGADVKSLSAFKRFHGQSEEYIKESGANFTHIRPGFFMSNLLNCVETIRQQNSICLPMGLGEVGIVSPRDVASVVYTVLTGDSHNNKTYSITGPEVLSFAQIAEQFSAELGREISYIDVPAEDFLKQLLSWGLDEWSAKEILGQFKEVSGGVSGALSNDFMEITNTAPSTLRQYIQDKLDIFQG